ncbi:hypothetical protein like AT5G60610 [Hibiscus trionum]|uniref:F-box domain-containing protein n=1 Tax=Hibiscus trionum TaxID=183268 RepID=A0A9W7IMF7_HIBTR|nr:hypothetical protein like AT5G60610 [Hibiscus trionum]
MERFGPKLSPCTWKKHKGVVDGQDRISKLPDEILILVLSFMTMKEAAKTSVISRRWQSLWTFHPCLEFDGSQALLQLRRPNKRRKAKEISVFESYRNWVNHMVDSRRLSAAAIDEFKIRFHLGETSKLDIDEWVRFAFEKKVKRFELNLTDYAGNCFNMDGCYPFCLPAISLTSFIPLKSLILKQVNVSSEVLTYFISNSPFLECLCVGGSRSLVHLRVIGPSLCLKYLEIIQCACMESLEIDAANLLSLKYSGPKINIPSMNVPNIAELLVGGAGLKYFTRKMLGMSTVSTQLEKLTFRMISVERQKWMKKYEFPILSHLKQLELSLFARDDESLLFFSSLINASPSLNKLLLELVWSEPRFERKVKKAKKCPHHSLKVVKISGFVGKTIDTEFCMYLFENAVMLEKITIDACPTFKGRNLQETKEVEKVNAARERAEWLKSEYFLGDKLEFCYSDN